MRLGVLTIGAYRRPGGQSATRTAIAGRMFAARRASPRLARIKRSGSSGSPIPNWIMRSTRAPPRWQRCCPQQTQSRSSSTSRFGSTHYRPSPRWNSGQEHPLVATCDGSPTATWTSRLHRTKAMHDIETRVFGRPNQVRQPITTSCATLQKADRPQRELSECRKHCARKHRSRRSDLSREPPTTTRARVVPSCPPFSEIPWFT
jgi:hypothetical protein